MTAISFFVEVAVNSKGCAEDAEADHFSAAASGMRDVYT
jgi:hypothetical protein